jgi:hypothetical protein
MSAICYVAAGYERPFHQRLRTGIIFRPTFTPNVSWQATVLTAVDVGGLNRASDHLERDGVSVGRDQFTQGRVFGTWLAASCRPLDFTHRKINCAAVHGYGGLWRVVTGMRGESDVIQCQQRFIRIWRLPRIDIGCVMTDVT